MMALFIDLGNLEEELFGDGKAGKNNINVFHDYSNNIH